jgi:hypothetical protein
MTPFPTPKSARSTALRLGLAAGLAVAGTASAAFNLPMMPSPKAQGGLIEVEAANADKVDQLVALAAIQSDLQLGLLFVQESGVAAAAPYLARPTADTWPAIKDGILAAGGTDLGPLLAAMQAGADVAVVYESYVQVSVGMAQTRTALAPTSADAVAAILTQMRQVAAGLNATGPTEADAYREAWAMLMTTRNQLDLLSRDPDQAVVKAVGEVALAMDDLILSLPYPVTADPVALDPALVLDAVKPLEAVAGGV